MLSQNLTSHAYHGGILNRDLYCFEKRRSTYRKHKMYCSKSCTTQCFRKWVSPSWPRQACNTSSFHVERFCNVSTDKMPRYTSCFPRVVMLAFRCGTSGAYVSLSSKLASSEDNTRKKQRVPIEPPHRKAPKWLTLVAERWKRRNPLTTSEQGNINTLSLTFVSKNIMGTIQTNVGQQCLIFSTISEI